MNHSFIESSGNESSNNSPRLNRSTMSRSSIRKNLTKKMFVNNITQQICDIRRKELRLKQREMILNAKEDELLQREGILLEKERAFAQKQQRTVLDSTSMSDISPRTRSITFEQLDTIDYELESTGNSENQTQPSKLKKKTKLFSFLRFKKPKAATQTKVNKIVREILVSDEEEKWMSALEVLSKMGSKDSTRRKRV